MIAMNWRCLLLDLSAKASMNQKLFPTGTGSPKRIHLPPSDYHFSIQNFSEGRKFTSYSNKVGYF